MLMFVWLLWGRGHNVPTHCSATLQSDSILDVGARSPDCTKAQSPRSASKTSASTASLLGAIGKFEQVQQSILAQIASKTDGNAMSEKKKEPRRRLLLLKPSRLWGQQKDIVPRKILAVIFFPKSNQTSLTKCCPYSDSVLFFLHVTSLHFILHFTALPCYLM